MQEILKRINRIPGVHGTIIVGADGLMMAADIAGEGDPQALGAVASSVAATVSSSLARMGLGAASRFVVNGSRGSVVLLHVGEAIVLTLVKKEANMGMVLVELKACSAAIGQALAG